MNILELAAGFALGTYIGRVAEDASVVFLQVRRNRKQEAAQEEAYAAMMRLIDEEIETPEEEVI